MEKRGVRRHKGEESMNHQTNCTKQERQKKRECRIYRDREGRGGVCKCLHPSEIYWSYKYPSGIHRSGTFESSAIWSRAHCSGLALNSRAEPQVPDCMSNFNSSDWISRVNTGRGEKKSLRDVPRRNLEVNNASSKNKHAEMDLTHAHTQVGKQRGHCASDWPRLFTMLVSMRTQEGASEQVVTSKSTATRPLSFYNQALYPRSANTVQLMKRHAAMTVAHPPSLSVCHCCSDGIPEAPLVVKAPCKSTATLNEVEKTLNYFTTIDFHTSMSVCT